MDTNPYRSPQSENSPPRRRWLDVRAWCYEMSHPAVLWIVVIIIGALLLPTVLVPLLFH